MVTQADLMPADGAHAARALGYLSQLLDDHDALREPIEAPLMIDLWAESVERTDEGVKHASRRPRADA